MPKLTVKSIEAIQRRIAAGELVPEWHSDGGGLVLRVRASGHMTFWLRQSGYAPMKLCDADAGLPFAREQALLAKAQRARGSDPVEERKARKAAQAEEKLAEKVAAVAPQTVTAVFDDYERLRLRPRLRSAAKVARTMRREVLPTWGALPISAITRAMVSKLVYAVAERSGPRAAELTLTYVATFFTWAEGMGYVAENVAAKVPRPVTNGARERVLSADELRMIWQAGDRIGWPDGPLAQLLMLSAQRKSEIGDGRWSEIDLDAKTWSLPKARTKNQTEHCFPLPVTAVEILRALPRIGGEDRIFAGPKGGASWGSARAKRALDAIVAELNNGQPIPHWTLHDLRRTAATGIADLGVAPHVIECVLNHIGGFRRGVGGVYNRSRYWPEMVDALARWDAKLQVIVSDADNVTPLLVKRGRR